MQGMFGGTNMVTKKDRRHSGYVTPWATISRKHLIENDLFIDDYYNEWGNYRDGMREWFRDFKKIKKACKGYVESYGPLYLKRIRMNRKQKKLLLIRKARESRINETIL